MHLYNTCCSGEKNTDQHGEELLVKFLFALFFQSQLTHTKAVFFYLLKNRERRFLFMKFNPASHQ